jgi:radical SAM-linked protein
MVRAKVRIRFRKTGDLRLISHHDLMRCFERILRRAALPFHSTSGFNPKPRLVFALSLPLGVVGCEEVVELELDEPLAPDEVQTRLARHAPPGLEIVRVRGIDPKTTAQVHRVRYAVALPQDRHALVAERIGAVLAATECWVERTRPELRRLDLRPYLEDVRLVVGTVEFDVRVTPHGTARPEELLTLLGLGDLTENGGVLERTRLELEDERSTPEEAAVPRDAASSA